MVVLSTSQLSASYARKLCAACEQPLMLALGGGEGSGSGSGGKGVIDGVVAIAHTEASGESAPNNYELLLRTLR